MTCCCCEKAYVYIVTNKRRGTLYIGVTTNLSQRAYHHKTEQVEGFTKRYRLKNLVYVEAHEEIKYAIQREKRLKEWQRQWKIELIEKENPEWEDLYERINI